MADVKIYTATKTDEVIAQAINNKGLNSVVKDVAVTEDGTGIKVVRSNGTETVVNFPAGGSVGGGLTQADIDSAIDALNLEQYALKSDIPDPQDLSSFVRADDPRLVDARTPVDHIHTASDITDFPSIPDISGLASKSDLAEAIDALPEVPSVSDLASKEELNNAISALPPVPDVSGLATKEEVDSLVYMTGEVRLVEEIPERIEVKYKVLSSAPLTWWELDVMKEGVFTVKTSEFAEGYLYDEIECSASAVLDMYVSVRVELFEKSTTGLKKLLASYLWNFSTHEVVDASKKKTPIPEGESSPAKALYDLVVKRLKEIEERERAEIPEAAVIVYQSRGSSLLAEVKSKHILSDGSAGPLSNVIERVDFEGSESDRSLVLSVSDGRKIPLPMEVPDITLHRPGYTVLKETPMSVVFQKGGSEKRVELSGSVGSVVYAPKFQKFIHNPFLQVECIVHDGMGVGDPSHEVITIPLPKSLDSDDGGMRLDVDVSTPPNVSPYSVAVPLVNPSGENGDPIKATISLYGNVVSARWVDVPSDNLFAVVPGAERSSSGRPTVFYPGVIPIGSDHEELSGGGDAGPFTPNTLGEMRLPARSYVELDVSTSTATAKFPKIASSGLMMTVCVIGPPENLSFPEGTVNIGHPSPVGGLSFATLLKRANGDWCVIWTHLPPTEGA